MGSAPAVVMDPLDGDVDNDLQLDGSECLLGSRPDIADPAIANCTIPVGCAQIPSATPGADPDGDLLFFGSSMNHSAVETYFRTRGVNLAVGQTHDVEGDGLPGDNDKDVDGEFFPRDIVLQDGWEVRYYGTLPATFDTDGDGCDDGREAADVNGDYRLNSSDQLSLAAAILNPYYAQYDLPDGSVRLDALNYDFNKDRRSNSGDQLIMAKLYAESGGPCQSTLKIGRTVINLTRGL
jgi:hypothetical protein